MQSDVRALLRVIGLSAVVAVVVIGVLTAAALKVLPREVAVGLALFVLVFGGIAIGRANRRALRSRDRPAD